MRKMSFICNIVVFIQGILLALIAVFLLNRQYSNMWLNYPNASRSVTIYLKDVAPEKQADVQQYLLQTSGEQHLFFVRRDLLVDNGGYSDGFKIGVCGDPTISGSSMSFLGENILDAKNLSLLLNSKNQNSTLGVDTGSINSIGSIPNFYFGGRIVVEKMPQLISNSATVNGAYSIMGFTEESQKYQFISELSKISGLSQEALVTQTNGVSIDDSFKLDILIVFLAFQVFLNFILFLVITVINLPKQGKLALLGWSRTAFAAKILGRFVVASIIGIPFFIIMGWLLSGWNEFSPMLLSYLSMAAIINLVLVVVELAVASVVIMMTKSLDAIRGRFSKKPLYILGILGYLLVSAGVAFCGLYVSGPMQTISENAKIASNWAKVSNYQMLRTLSAGQDADSISGQSIKLGQDVYNWYKSIADKSGVFLIHTSYYGSDILAGWSNYNTYKSIPEKPFWYFAVSPNYLPNLNIKLSDDDINNAKNGTRLYLLPSTLSNTERERMIAWIRESDSATGDIQDKFTQQQNFKFVTYIPESNLFTWASDTNSKIQESAPIIYVCTPENMGFIESESLRATGFNGYIKFADDKAMKQYTQPDILSRFNLTDNDLSFSSVQQYIDGLQKDLWTTIEWFGLVFLFLFIILVGLLITLATIFRISNQEKINVKKFLGFSFWQLYKTPTLMLISIIVLELAVMIALRSNFGILVIVISSLLQLLIFAKYMARSELKRVLLAFKGGS